VPIRFFSPALHFIRLRYGIGTVAPLQAALTQVREHLVAGVKLAAGIRPAEGLESAP
jgi:hypothetical protein